MSLRLMLVTAALSASAAYAAPTSRWEGYSTPNLFDQDKSYQYKFSDLPLNGMIDISNKGWSGPYWPNFQGGINYRWNSPKPEGFNLISPNIDLIKRMTVAELAQLAPSEKWDIYTGNYNYPLKNYVAARVKPEALDWEGICHGWAPAAIHHNEPTPKTLINKDGITVPFGSSDIKALLSYYYAKFHKGVKTNQTGRRCGFGERLQGTKYCKEDLNAGAFHLIIANQLGIKKEGFQADVVRTKEVWNQPIVGFSSRIIDANLPLSRSAAKSAVKEMRIETDFHYGEEVENITWETVQGTNEQVILTKKYLYRIELNAKGEIVGGTWESIERPDFLWRKPKVETFTGMFEGLEKLLND